MDFEPWYKVVTPREEVRKGRSFNPDEFAIALEQVSAEASRNLVQEIKQILEDSGVADKCG